MRNHQIASLRGSADWGKGGTDQIRGREATDAIIDSDVLRWTQAQRGVWRGLGKGGGMDVS